MILRCSVCGEAVPDAIDAAKFAQIVEKVPVICAACASKRYINDPELVKRALADHERRFGKPKDSN